MIKGEYHQPQFPVGYGSEGYQTWYVTKEEQQQAEKRYKANGFKVSWFGDVMQVWIPGTIVLVYKIMEQPEEPVQLSFL